MRLSHGNTDISHKNKSVLAGRAAPHLRSLLMNCDSFHRSFPERAANAGFFAA